MLFQFTAIYTAPLIITNVIDIISEIVHTHMNTV